MIQKLKNRLLIVVIIVCNYSCIATSVSANNAGSYANYYNVIYSFVKESNSNLDTATVDWMAKSIIYYASMHNVQPLLLTALIRQESNFNLYAQSGAGAYGLAQIMPETASSLGINNYNPVENIEGGARYLATQMSNFETQGEYSTAYALAAYNAGPGAIKKYGGIPPYSETLNYIERVFVFYKELVTRYRSLN